MSRRPEYQAPPDIFYNEDEARKYTKNTRMIEIQARMSERALELLALPEDVPCYLLDLGCGSGLSGTVLEEDGHYWVGCDISRAMLSVAKEREIETGDLILSDLGEGLPFKPGSFDGAISISAIQWLCNQDKKDHRPAKRLYTFFSTLYAVLSRGSRAVFQFYPENGAQVELITQQAMKAGFTGGIVVDFPNSTKAKKMYLVLFCGGQNQTLPKALGTDSAEVSEEEDDEPAHIKVLSEKDKWKQRREKMRRARGKPLKGSKEWIITKKERRRRQGREVRPDNKYTGRKRSGRF